MEDHRYKHYITFLYQCPQQTQSQNQKTEVQKQTKKNEHSNKQKGQLYQIIVISRLLKFPVKTNSFQDQC